MGQLTGLYERWLATLERFADNVAIRMAATGETVTFGQLQRLLDAQPVPAGPLFPQGRSVDFFVQALTAWRYGQLLCPLDGARPSVLPEANCGALHAKMTSGSSGAPRLILFTASQLAADAENIVRTMGLRPDSPNVVAISLAHSYGFSNVVLPLLLHGIPATLVAEPFPAAVELALQLTPNATLPAVPAHWRAWYGSGLLTRISDVRLAISAGAPLPLALETAIYEETGIKVHNFYGSSECGGIAFDATTAPRASECVLGTAMQGVSTNCEPATGRLIVSSAAVGLGGFPEPIADMLPGQFKTQDLVESVSGGVLRLIGRVGDVMNLAGRKLHPSMVESALAEIPGVLEVLVFGVPSAHQARGEEAVALVRHDSTLASLASIQKEAAQRLPAWQCPKHWLSEPKLAANERGKLSRAAWRQWYLDKKKPSAAEE